MKAFLLAVLILVVAPALLVGFFHLCIFKPKKAIHRILKALRDGPKTPFQIEQATGLSPKNVAMILDTLERQLGFVRREAHPAIDPSRNPEAPSLFHLTEQGALEIGTEN